MVQIVVGRIIFDVVILFLIGLLFYKVLKRLIKGMGLSRRLKELEQSINTLEQRVSKLEEKRDL